MNTTNLNLGSAAHQNVVLLQSVHDAVSNDTDGTILKLRARLAGYPNGSTTVADNVQAAMLAALESELDSANAIFSAI